MRASGGSFLLYAHTVMPGLGATDDRTFVGAFQEIDPSVENPFVTGTFIGGIILIAATIVLERRRPHGLGGSRRLWSSSSQRS